MQGTGASPQLLHPQDRAAESQGHEEHFDHLPNTEAISVLEISEKMIAQTVISPGISEVYSELLTATRDTNEIYLVPIPHPWLGRTFQDVRLGLAAIEEPVCLLGFTNAVMAYEEPEWHEEAPAFENSPVLAADTASG